MQEPLNDDIALSETDVPLSESSVSLKLAVIQLRCAQLLRAKENAIELSLEDAVVPGDAFNPYDRS
ncbi:MAG: hypothetical protein KJO01_04840 [Gammaproteobacteria bacterium]|nr:hypothetical protein [Gammaproteobacteria bacterium]MBT8111704.1 hypothetical protein [Gammaproteobacteria bacterium]NND46842.1 hypothetical protein [Woeseiaceae bacterium]NNL46402.1 hypothetical protein [Woeseiaceae bacterium]